MARRANIIPIDERVTLIDDAGESTCYLVTGEDSALLIDTMNGKEDLHAIVRELTSLPVTVVNTHGHLDHIYGNIFFEEAYLHPADWAMHDGHFAFPEGRELLARTGLRPCRLLPLADGKVFDLGGLKLEVISIPGHSPGSVALLCREKRLLFTGDGVNGHLWMQLREATPFAALIRSLERLLEEHRGEFDFILTGHGKGPEDAALADQLLTAARELLAGQYEGDRPYSWFGNIDRCHLFGEGGQHLIAYNRDKLDAERCEGLPPIRHVANNPKLSGLADVRLNIVYSTAAGKDLTLALLVPWGAKERGEKLPLLVFVQGSAWTSPDIGFELGQLAEYARRGIAVATVTHRNCLEGNPFPAYLQDVKTAIRFLRQNADEYALDPNRVGIFGTSSGGNTALLVGLTGDEARYKTSEYADQSDSVKLVVECFGPTDLKLMIGERIPDGAPFGDIFHGLAGKRDEAEVLAEMSPIHHVMTDTSYPPFLLIHGDLDDVVPYDQMTRMYRVLREQGADASAICVDGAPHEGSFWSRELLEIIYGFVSERL